MVRWQARTGVTAMIGSLLTMSLPQGHMMQDGDYPQAMTSNVMWLSTGQKMMADFAGSDDN